MFVSIWSGEAKGVLQSVWVRHRRPGHEGSYHTGKADNGVEVEIQCVQNYSPIAGRPWVKSHLSNMEYPIDEWFLKTLYKFVVLNADWVIRCG